MKSFDLVVASHLRWSYVWQRPQQLLSRLARHHTVLFVEEPIFQADDEPAAPLLSEVHPGIITLVPRIHAAQAGDTPLWLWPGTEAVGAQVRDGMRALGLQDVALWFYTPTPEFLVDAVSPDMLVYDVMDELANFRFAPPQLREREIRLLGRSAIVFTGGASLYDAKKHLNPNTHLFASGVDAAHYEHACHYETAEPDWMASIARPRATYIGVIDERIDYEIVAAMAAARPDVQFLMCGPTAKIDPADLPAAPNLHYPGQQSYADLPRILKGSDICLMPFAMNDATRYISPTKTLEYMATHRPIVSTSIKDVARYYSDIVYLADGADQFVAQIDAALNESVASRSLKRRREEKILAEQAWDAIADSMENLMMAAWGRTPAGKRQAATQRRQPAPGAPAWRAASHTAAAINGGE